MIALLIVPRILAFDLGTTTGWAYHDTAAPAMFCDSIRLATAKEVTAWGKSRLTRRGDPRIQRFFDFVKEMVSRHAPQVVCFEDVQFSTFTGQTQMWASLRAALWLAVGNTFTECIGVSALKKFATGSGAATKELMKAELLKKYPLFSTRGDDAVDAAWVCLWAKDNLKRMF